MIFTTVEQLKTYIQKDSKVSTINPVRFINVESIDMWIKVKNLLNMYVSTHLKISNFCEDNDTAPNLFLLKNRIRKLQGSAIITPISEYLRINNAIARKTFDEILHINYDNSNGKLRIYIPVYRMKEILNTINLDPRNINSMLFLDTNREDDYSLTIVQDNLDVNIDGNRIDGFKNYFVYWEENPDKPIILYTKNAIHYHDVVFSDDVKVIVSSYDLLKIHYKLPLILREEYGTEEQWHYLAKLYNNNSELDSLISNMFGVNSAFSINIFKYWNDVSNNDKWLLWLWSKSKDRSGYIGVVLKKSKSFDDFIFSVYVSIGSFLNSNDYKCYYNERMELIRILGVVPPMEFWEYYKKQPPECRIKILTKYSKKEKIEIIKNLNGLSRNTCFDILDIVYPELKNYLDNFIVDKSIDEYFDRYRWAKVLDLRDSSFINLVNEIANEKGERIFKFKSRNSIVNDLYTNNSVILFVDALGAEYFPLLKSIFEGEFYIGYCNMPSTTHNNNDFFKDRNNYTIYKLDELKHSNIQYPENIIEEIDIIISLKKEVDSLLSEYESVIIAADHGTSRLAVINRECSNVYKEELNARKYKYGRYCEDNKNSYNFDGIINYDNFWIFANYDRFAQHGAPIDEIHGGASLEEMLVPIIRISKNKQEATQQYNIVIDLLTPEVKMSIDKKVIIKFNINQQLDEVYAVVNGNRIKCTYNNGIYSFEHNVENAEKYIAQIVSKSILGEIKYRVIKGISSKMDF